MKKLLIALCLLASPVMAATNFVFHDGTSFVTYSNTNKTTNVLFKTSEIVTNNTSSNLNFTGTVLSSNTPLFGTAWGNMGTNWVGYSNRTYDIPPHPIIGVDTNAPELAVPVLHECTKTGFWYKVWTMGPEYYSNYFPVTWAVGVLGEQYTYTNEPPPPPPPAGWTDPYSTNSVGYALFVDGQSSTNTTAAYGSVGGIADNGQTNFGVATHHVISNFPSVATGPTWEMLGTNSLGTEIRAWHFDGSDDWADVVNRIDLSFGNGTVEYPHTIGFWFKHISRAGSYNGILAKYTATGNSYEWRVTLESTYKLNARYVDKPHGYAIRDWTTDSALPTNTWMHVCIVNDGTASTNSVIIYTNAVLAPRTLADAAAYVATSNTAASLSLNTAASGVASFHANQYLAYVSIMRTNLSPTEVTNLYVGLGGAGGPTNATRAKLPAEAYP